MSIKITIVQPEGDDVIRELKFSCSYAYIYRTETWYFEKVLFLSISLREIFFFITWNVI